MNYRYFVSGKGYGFLVLFICVLFSAAGAVADDVTISGQPSIIIDTNYNNVPDIGDYRWRVEYDPGASNDPFFNGTVSQRTGDGVDTSVDRIFFLEIQNLAGPVVVDEYNPWYPEYGRRTVTVTREGTGNTTGYNTVEFANNGTAFCKLNLYDTDNDGLADAIQGWGDASGQPRICADYALSASAIETHAGVDYFMMDFSGLPITPVLRNSQAQKPFTKVFIPVMNPAGIETPYVTVASNGTTWGGAGARITPAIPSPIQIPCTSATTAIPTIDEYGAALIMLLLLAVGIWIMRKRGFGERMTF